MRRRHFLPLALCLPLARWAWAQPASAEPEDDAPAALPQYKVSAAALLAAVAQRFPLRYPIAGLLNLDVQEPSLRLLPAPLETICLRGNAGKIESLLLREYLRARHSLPAPEPPRSFEGGYTDLFFEGLARDVHHCDVRSLYPSLLLRAGRGPRNDSLGVFLQLLSHLRDFRIEEIGD